MIMQRTHQGDLSGHVLETGGWTLCKLPTRFVLSSRCTIVYAEGTKTWSDLRKKDGELLNPALWDEEAITLEEKRLRTFGFSGQHQQEPVPFILHKLGEVNAAGPSDKAWLTLGGLVDEMMRLREAGDRKGQAEALNRLLDTIRVQRSGAIAMREASEMINTYSKVADRESRRQERAAAVVSVTAFLGFAEMLTQQVNIHVADPAERAAVAKAFSDPIRRAGLADLERFSKSSSTR